MNEENNKIIDKSCIQNEWVLNNSESHAVTGDRVSKRWSNIVLI